MRALCLALAVLLAGCNRESDEQKLERLRHDAQMAMLDVVGWERRVEAAKPTPGSLLDSLEAARNRHTIANARVENFLRSR